MSQGRITLGFKPEVLEQVRGVRRPLVSAVLLRSLGVLAGLIIVGTALVLTTDIEELLYPRTIILRGNRLSAAAEVLEVSNMPQAINSAILLPGSKELPEGKSRWIKGYSTKMLPGRRMLLSVDERMPLLPLEIAGNAYWICSDGEVVLRDPEKDTAGHFEELNSLPLVSMEDSGIDADYAVTDTLILVSGLCHEMLDRRVTGIGVSSSGDFTLRTDRGLDVLLGTPGDEEELRHRISALSKAIRISDEYRDATAIDLRNGKVAYLKTKGHE
ncbi:cell division protein FtsQ/DivIB [bacterium]|nr:cell division protein FtsQ/DivIB [bacterium]